MDNGDARDILSALRTAYWRGAIDGLASGIAAVIIVALVTFFFMRTAAAQSLKTELTWHIMPSVQAAREKCFEVLGGGNAISCSRWNKQRTWCEIWSIDPTTVINNEYHERVMGHEAVHCFKGDFHKGRPN